MSEVMTEEQFFQAVSDMLFHKEKHRDEFQASYLKVLRAYSAALAAPDPRVGPLVEALEASVQCIEDFLEIYKRGGSMLVMDQAVKSLHDDALRLAKKALFEREFYGAAAKGEPAEDLWCNEEEHSYPVHGNRYEVRGHGVMMFIDPPHTHCYWIDNDTECVVAFEDTEWRPVREG